MNNYTFEEIELAWDESYTCDCGNVEWQDFEKELKKIKTTQKAGEVKGGE